MEDVDCRTGQLSTTGSLSDSRQWTLPWYATADDNHFVEGTRHTETVLAQPGRRSTPDLASNSCYPATIKDVQGRQGPTTKYREQVMGNKPFIRLDHRS